MIALRRLPFSAEGSKVGSLRAWAPLGLSALAIVAGAPGIARAQSDDSQAVEKSRSARDQLASETISEVIVTAQRRDEPLQKVPIAVTAVSAAQVADSTFLNLGDLQFLAPSVQYQPSTAPVYQIRGVGTQTFDFGIEGSVGVFIDNVVQAMPRSSNIGTFADLRQVEVLRGPQGTLFGKNTSAGAIVITTNRPQFTGLHNTARLTYGTDNETLLQDTLNIPISETLAARLTGAWQRRDGFVTNRAGGEKLYEYENASAYAKLLWAPTEQFELYFIGDYQSHDDNAGSQWTIRSFGVGTATNPAIVPANFIQQQLTSYGIVPGADNYDGAWNGPSYSRDHTVGGQVEMNYELGSGHVLTSVSAYRDYSYDVATDSDSTVLAFFDINNAFIESTQLSQEIRIASPSGGRFEYVAGLYYFNLLTDAGGILAGTLGLLPLSSPIVLTTSGSGAPRWHVDSTSYAAFANGTLHVTDKLGLVLGARYTYDDLLSRYNIVAQPGVCQIAFALGGPCTAGVLPTPYRSLQVEEGDWSGRVGVQYQFTDRIMGYATVARGYKGPTVNNVAGAATPVRPETSVDYELGVKSELFDRLVLNIALFHDKFKDFQAQTYDTSTTPGTFQIANAGGLLSKGVELEFTARVTDDFDLSGGATYTDAHFTDYLTRCNPGVCSGMVDPRSGLFVPGLFQAAGEQLTAAPRWTYLARANYRHGLDNGLVIDANAHWMYKSAVYFSVGDPNTRQEGFGLFNAGIGIGPQDRSWRVGLFARNLFDQRFAARIGPTPFDARGYRNGPDPSGGNYRTVGVSFDLGF